jgi:hypothetical protein
MYKTLKNNNYTNVTYEIRYNFFFFLETALMYFSPIIEVYKKRV